MFKFLHRTSLYLLAIPLMFTLLGAMSNQLVLLVNHDTFPVSINPVKLQIFTGGKVHPDEQGTPVIDGGLTLTLPDGTVMEDSIHCVMTEKTHLNLFADVFDFHDSVESIGDLSIDLGTWLWVFAPYVWAFAVIEKLLKVE